MAGKKSKKSLILEEDTNNQSEDELSQDEEVSQDEDVPESEYESEKDGEADNDDEAENEASPENENPSASSSSKSKVQKKKGQYGVVIHNGDIMQIQASGTVLREIKRLQYSTNLIFPRAAFARVIKEITQQYGDYKYHSLALEAIQEAAELFLVGYLSDSYQLTRHRKKETLSVEDTQMLTNLLIDLVPGLRPL